MHVPLIPHSPLSFLSLSPSYQSDGSLNPSSKNIRDPTLSRPETRSSCFTSLAGQEITSTRTLQALKCIRFLQCFFVVLLGWKTIRLENWLSRGLGCWRRIIPNAKTSDLRSIYSDGAPLWIPKSTKKAWDVPKPSWPSPRNAFLATSDLYELYAKQFEPPLSYWESDPEDYSDHCRIRPCTQLNDRS